MSSEVPKFLRGGVWAKFVLQLLFPPPTENLVETGSQTMKKRERQASAASYYTSLKTGFFDCCYLVFFDSVLSLHSDLLLRVSQYNFQILFPSKWDSVEITR